MSSEHYGRTYPTRQEYHSSRTATEAETLRRVNNQLQAQANQQVREITSLQRSLNVAQNDIKQAAVIQSRLEEKQRQLKSVQEQIAQRHKEFEARTIQRQQMLEREIQVTEQRANEQIAELRNETSQKIVAVQNEVGSLKQDMNKQFEGVHEEIRETRRHLEKSIDATRADLEAERQRRISKETTRTAKAAAMVDWLNRHLQGRSDLDSLGLTMEWTRTMQHIERTREALNGDDKEMAWPLAETAFASYQTLYLETERRVGVIEGVAQHVQELAAMLEAISLNEHFRLIFRQEAEQLTSAVVWLRKHASQWRERRQWVVFEVEREQVMTSANELLTQALELEAIVPSLLKQLQSREQKLKEVGAAVASISGAADRFEVGYANSEDAKSPRLLRAHIGSACIDTYVDLDGTYRIDAYGFNSHGQCAEAAERMGHSLAEKWQVTEQNVDTANRQQAVIAPPETSEPWMKISSDLTRVAGKITGGDNK